MAVALLCVAHYVLGSRMNRKHAEQWLDEVRGVVGANFKDCGTQDTGDDTFEYVDGEPVPPKPKSSQTDANAQSLYFEDISPNQFPLLLSGRHNLVYANLNLVLSKRHDIAQMLGTILFGRWVDVQRDRLWIEIPIVRAD